MAFGHCFQSLCFLDFFTQASVTSFTIGIDYRYYSLWRGSNADAFQRQSDEHLVPWRSVHKVQLQAPSDHIPSFTKKDSLTSVFVLPNAFCLLQPITMQFIYISILLEIPATCLEERSSCAISSLRNRFHPRNRNSSFSSLLSFVPGTLGCPEGCHEFLCSAFPAYFKFRCLILSSFFSWRLYCLVLVVGLLGSKEQHSSSDFSSHSLFVCSKTSVVESC